METVEHQGQIESIIKKFEERKKRADFRYPVGKTSEVEVGVVHELVGQNRTEVYRCVYAVEDGSYVLFIKPR